MSTLKHIKTVSILFVLALLVMPGVLAQAQQEAAIPFQVTVTWVNGRTQAPEEMVYGYQFVNKDTQEVYPLILDAAKQALPTADTRIVAAKAEVLLPEKNPDDTKALYLLSAAGTGYVEQDGLPYAVSTTESQDPSVGSPYYHRSRVLTQQIAPLVQVEFDGVDAQPFDLTLFMSSWAQAGPGNPSKAQHHATHNVQQVPQAGLDLIKLFSTDPEDAVRFRHFTYAELSWDGAHIAGQNHFTLQVGDVPGLFSQVSGSAAEGFRILLKKAP